MIVPLAAVLAVLLPAPLGGRLARFAVLRLRSTEVIGAAFLAQLGAVKTLPGPRWLLVLLHLGSYVAAGAFVWVNRRVPGMVVLGLGALVNGMTIAVNAGTLPASPTALARAGMLTADAGFVNSGVVHAPRLAFLGDVFAVPAGLPLANVFSVGDVLIVLGAGWASWRICGTRWSAPWRPRPAGHAKGRHIDGLFLPDLADDDDRARRRHGRRAATRPPARRAARRVPGATRLVPPVASAR